MTLVGICPLYLPTMSLKTKVAEIWEVLTNWGSIHRPTIKDRVLLVLWQVLIGALKLTNPRYAQCHVELTAHPGVQYSDSWLNDRYMVSLT